MLRIALDTNVLVYSEAVERSPADGAKIAQSRQLMRALIAAGEPPVLAVQALAELFHVLVRRGGFSAAESAERVGRLRDAGEIAAVTQAVMEAALDLAVGHNLQIFDAIILAAAAEARCDLLLSEDFHDGFAWRGLVVTNPYGPSPDSRVKRLIAGL